MKHPRLHWLLVPDHSHWYCWGNCCTNYSRNWKKRLLGVLPKLKNIANTWKEKALHSVKCIEVHACTFVPVLLPQTEVWRCTRLVLKCVRAWSDRTEQHCTSKATSLLQEPASYVTEVCKHSFFQNWLTNCDAVIIMIMATFYFFSVIIF